MLIFRQGIVLAILDAVLFLAFFQTGIAWQTAHLASFTIAFLLTSLIIGFGCQIGARSESQRAISSFDILAALCVLCLRGGLLATLIDCLGVAPMLAAVWGGIFSAAAFLGGCALWSCEGPVAAGPEKHRNRWLLGSVIGFVVLLRLLYSGPLELLHEEGYYWLYAQFIDIGYLDHPPMVGWLIWLFTSVFGSSEFGIRVGAFSCWLIAAFYTARLSLAMGGVQAGWISLALVAVLPAFFSTGMFMTPDSPLIACWAAALYYLYVALILERPGAWLGVGVFMGLGLLSKYTMVLLGGAAWGYLLLCPEGRRWLTRPHPYLAALLALALFSPVVAWNAENQWASFFFQGVDRHRGDFNFGLQDLIGSILVLMTPVVLLSLGKLIRFRKQLLGSLPDTDTQRSIRLFAYLTLLPLSVFFAFSLFKMSKLNWTAPIWLGVLPCLALFINPIGKQQKIKPTHLRLFPRLWPLTTATLLVFYGGFFHYMSIGFPGLPYPQNSLDMGKRSLARQILSAKEAFTEKAGEKPMVVCWDSERMASWMAYYLTRENSMSRGKGTPEAVLHTTGPHLFNEESRMFRYWHPQDSLANRTFLLIGDTRWKLEYPRVLSKALPISDVNEVLTEKNGKSTGRYYYRFFVEDSNQLALLQ